MNDKICTTKNSFGIGFCAAQGVAIGSFFVYDWELLINISKAQIIPQLLFSAIICWGRFYRVKDLKKLNKLMKKAGFVLGKDSSGNRDYS